MTQQQSGRLPHKIDRHRAWRYKLRDDPKHRRGAMVLSGAPSTRGETMNALQMHYEPDRIEWVEPIGDPDVSPCEGSCDDAKKTTKNSLQRKHSAGRDANDHRRLRRPTNRGKQKP